MLDKPYTYHGSDHAWALHTGKTRLEGTGAGASPQFQHTSEKHRHVQTLARTLSLPQKAGSYLLLILLTILGWEIHTGPFECESSCPERWQGRGWNRRGDTHTA